MGNQQTKLAPGGIPQVHQELAEKIERAQQEPAAGQDLSIRMVIDGGEPEEHFRFVFEALGAGEINCGLICALTQREHPAERNQLPPDEFRTLLTAVELPELVKAYRPLKNIPPGSLVGRLEIRDSQQTFVFQFMADSGQAESAGHVPSPALMKLIETIYEIGGRQLGEDVRP